MTPGAMTSMYFAGGPRDGRHCLVRVGKKGMPGVIACAVEAAAKGMRGIYKYDPAENAMLWKELPNAHADQGAGERR